MTVDKERLEQKLGEAIGLEMAAQKAVDELSKGLLPDEAPTKKKLEGMRKEANNHQTQMEDLVTKLSQSDGTDPKKIQRTAQDWTKGNKKMETYLGENPDSQEAMEFLCLGSFIPTHIFSQDDNVVYDERLKLIEITEEVRFFLFIN